MKDVRSLAPGEIVWDSAVAGFGVRRQRSSAVAYVLIYRTENARQRWHTIGRHGAPWTPDSAREEARRLLGLVAGGQDPASKKLAARKAATVAELCDLYFTEVEAGRLLTRRKEAKRATTLLTDRGRIHRHIVPLLGAMPVASVTRSDIEQFMHAVADGQTAVKERTEKPNGLANVRGGRGTASRTVGLLGAIFSYAHQIGLRPDNPVHGVVRYADGRRLRRLSEDEYHRLGDALRAAKGRVWPAAIAVVEFLALTGWRSGEALQLQWRDLDLPRRTARLAETKTGASVRPLSSQAIGVLQAQGRGGGRLFPASRGGGTMSGLPSFWRRIRALADLPSDVTPHVLRHSFASLAADLGYSEPTIAALIGHVGRSMTSRYVHSADAVLLAAADAVAGRTAQLMAQKETDRTTKSLRG